MFEATDVFYANYKSESKITINQGGTSCFDGNQLVITTVGNIPIKDITQNHIVKCFNEKNNFFEWRKVLNTFCYKNSKPTIKVVLKNGNTITATEDHKFYYEGDWHTLKHLLSLWNDRKMEKNPKL